MNLILAAFFAFTIMWADLSTLHAGVLATNENIINGKKNLADPLFSKSVETDTGIGAAVNYLVTGSQEMGNITRAKIMRSALEARENLSKAVVAREDVSSLQMYEALVSYDLVSELGLFSEDEIEALKKSLKPVFLHYLNPEICDWSNDYWSCGVSAMRIIASYALYALNFPEDENSDSYLQHSNWYFRKNLNDSIDDYGAWVADSPGSAGEALRYMVVTAKALKNSGINDYFSNPRLKNLLLYEMHLLPPQQCPSVKGVFMIAAAGQTDPGINHGGNAVIAAADIYPYFPDDASYLIWYWNQCDNPSDALGLLFIDSDIPYMRPESMSSAAGGGMAVLRDNFATARESAVFAGFGDPFGVHDREGSDHSDHGDFSFVWSGIPLLVHDGFTDSGYSENLMNRTAWRHNSVLYDGAGDSPVVPESILNQTVKYDITGNNNVPADFYPDGISQFLSTEMVDYVSGPVRLAKSDMPAPSHYRHFLFLKPDALLIWDQIESPFPLEWNLWMSVTNAQTDRNVLKIYTENNVELQILFAGDNRLDYEIERPAEEKIWDWPLIMRSEFGSGTVTVVTVDLVREALTDSSTFGLNVLQNILYQQGKPEVIGYIGGNKKLMEILEHFKIRFENPAPGDLGDSDLSNYSILLIDDSRSGSHESDLSEHIWKIHNYIRNGGNAVWMCSSPLHFKPENISGPGIIPATIAYGVCPVELFNEINPQNEITINEDPLWLTPNIINSDDWIEWVSGNLPNEKDDENGIPLYTPAAWSDSWKVLASLKKSFPVKSYSNDALGQPSRIRVKHPSSKDFFALLLPRKTSESYNFNVIEEGRGYVTFVDPVTTWEIRAGETSWTDANLSVKISREGGFETLYAFDCTYIASESERISSKSPMSIYYSPREDRGIIMTASNNVITFSKGIMKLHAGEIEFFGLNNMLSMERAAFVTDLTVVDTNGASVEWARVYVNGSFTGSTNKDGRIPVRWEKGQPGVSVKYRGAESKGLLVPGEMNLMLTGD